MRRTAQQGDSAMKQTFLSQPHNQSHRTAGKATGRPHNPSWDGIYCILPLPGPLRCKMIDKRMWASQTPLRHFKAGP